jgi:uncharacterized protein (UPF0261 family)
MKPTVVFVSTYDTKGAESEFIKKNIEDMDVACVTIDVGVGAPPVCAADVGLAELCGAGPHSPASIRALRRGEAIAVVSGLLDDFVCDLHHKGGMNAIIGIGGAGGTQIVTQAMRSLPFGLPKLMLSTLASGNTRWYLQASDIAMIPSIADVAGLNGVTRLVFGRFAALAAQSALWHANRFPHCQRHLMDRSVRRVSLTMYGTTTKGVSRAKCRLEDRGIEPLVFHASGAGGQSMEGFIRDGIVHGVLDMTIAEVGAHLVGGLHDAGPHRMEAAVEAGLPFVLVPGAADTVVLPPMSALPEKFKGRTLNFHNPTMTTMRTSAEECVAIGRFLVEKLGKARRPIKVLLPRGGLSSIDRPGEIFYLPAANEALFATLKDGLGGVPHVEIIDDPRHIDDDGFGQDAADLQLGLMA